MGFELPEILLAGNAIAKQVSFAGTMISHALGHLGDDIKSGLIDGFKSLNKSQEEIASANRELNRENNRELVEAILNGTSYIAKGLLQIASEMQRNNTLTERRDLETKISRIENWLFEQGFLKEFYQTAELEKKYIPTVKSTYFYFLDNMFSATMGVLNEERVNSTQLDFETFLKQISQREGGFPKYKQELEEKLGLNELKSEFCTFCMHMLCHPLVALAYLISQNGLVLREHLTAMDKFYIAGTDYGWEVDVLSCNKDGLTYDFHTHKIVFKNNGYSLNAKLNFEEALYHLVYIATHVEEHEFPILLVDIKLEWENFFSNLNLNIAMHNLRMLSQSLENFQRKKMLA